MASDAPPTASAAAAAAADPTTCAAATAATIAVAAAPVPPPNSAAYTAAAAIRADLAPDDARPGAFFERIGLSRDDVAAYDGSHDAAFRLHAAFTLAVPFESADIALARRRIVLDMDAILAKLIDGRRGGFCFELNGAFGWLLAALGHTVFRLSARIWRPALGMARPHTHMMLRAVIGGDDYIVEVRAVPVLCGGVSGVVSS